MVYLMLTKAGFNNLHAKRIDVFMYFIKGIFSVIAFFFGEKEQNILLK